ncbi:hypothetical protein AVEN_104942-1 [Araneus ventricosus]|uniref:C2H2-type domain-containing protein n=1 Tax=Araneus ventricosus TaxID=182803 RepID=A0A4Y2SR74_ARAVE|nr:hypothetical protein AVEN_104942-1 [Araneus ventricosus]
MLMNGSEPGPSHAPSGFVQSNESWSDTETDVEWMNNVPMSIKFDEPGSSQAPSGFGYIVPTSSLVPPSTNDHVCDACKKTFSNKFNLKRHMKKHGVHANHACSQCSMKFYHVDELREHMRTHTCEKKTHPCEQCDQVFPRMSDLLRHKRTDHSAPPSPRIAAPRARNSGRNALGVYSFHFMTPSSHAAFDLLLFLEEIRPQIHGMIVD